MVTAGEVQELRNALAGAMLPPDFRAKLAGLYGQDLTRHYVGSHSRLFVSLLLAAQNGAFPAVTLAERERLLKVLAYVRKENDAIADYEEHGFADDLEEVRAAAAELAPLLERFKRWRLQHQVPAMWLECAAGAGVARASAGLPPARTARLTSNGRT